MLGAKPRQKTKNKTLFLILGYLIAANLLKVSGVTFSILSF